MFLSAAAWLAIAATGQIWDAGRTPHNPANDPPVTAPADGTRDILESIRNGQRSGQLSRKEARRLRRQAGATRFKAFRYARDGLSHSESQELVFEIEALRGLVMAERTRGIATAGQTEPSKP
ncbi:hypothetical protein [Sphingomonas sp. 37zxx]|uniref:hypothetical protein n=1 Tax=Sphingomonas sp. 37zxx TaxID=1550073 RepID=UPI00068E8E20|nr:hypothetical protein [Sphingomonas sp. 37zxx]